MVLSTELTTEKSIPISSNEIGITGNLSMAYTQNITVKIKIRMEEG